jgi:hypothetical protein
MYYKTLRNTETWEYGKQPPEIQVISNWRSTKPGTLAGKYILLDNWIVAKVISEHKDIITLDRRCRIRRTWLYAFYVPNNRLEISTKFQSEEDAWKQRMLYCKHKKRLCPVEMLLLAALMSTYDKDAAVRAVWGRRLHYMSYIKKYLLYEQIKGLIMNELQKAFKEAQVDGTKLLKRMYDTSNKVNKSLDDPDITPKDKVAVATAAFDMDSKLMTLWKDSMVEEATGVGYYTGDSKMLETTNYTLIEGNKDEEDSK